MRLGKAKKLILPLIGLTILLSGCGEVNNDAPGFYKYLAIPTTSILNFLAHLGGYGLALVILTVIIRLVLIPVSLNQTRGTTIHQFKLRPIKKQVDKLKNDRINAPTREARSQAAQKIRQLYKKYNISSTGGVGCLSLVVQIIIFMSLYSAIKYSAPLFHSRFLGVYLGSHTWWLPVIVFLLYLLQVYISARATAGQKNRALWALFVSPTMILLVCFGSPAGISVYFLVCSIFACLQAHLTQVYQKRLSQRIRNGQVDLGKTPRTDEADRE